VALTRTQEAALALARDADWRAELAATSGSFKT
jgi:hypothetical protein